MSIPVTKTYYCTTGSISGSGFGELNINAPNNFSASALGWNMGTNNPPLFCELNFSAEVVRTSTQWHAAPTGSAPSNNASGSGTSNCWAFGPLSGEFSSGSWFITMSVKSVTNASNQTGRFQFRFWKGGNISGSDATLITSTFYSSSVNPAVTGGAGVATVQPLTASIDLPNIVLRNEYIFIQTYWSIVAAGGNNGADKDYVLGKIGSLVITSPFIQDRASLLGWEQGTI